MSILPKQKRFKNLKHYEQIVNQLKRVKKQLFTEIDLKSDEDILKTDPHNKKVCEKAFLIDVGIKGKVLFSGNLIWNEQDEKFQKECLRFYQTDVKYLLEVLSN